MVQELKIGDHVQINSPSCLFHNKCGKIVNITGTRLFERMIYVVQLDHFPSHGHYYSDELIKLSSGFKEEESFWMIWNEDNRPPTKKHYSLDDVIRELDRLAKNNPNDKFYLLKSVGEAKAHTITTVNRIMY